MSISPSAFVEKVRGDLIPFLVKGEASYTTTETGGQVWHATESMETGEKVEVDAFEMDGETHAMVIWGAYDLNIRTAEDEFVLFINKDCLSSNEACVFTTLDALFERVRQLL